MCHNCQACARDVQEHLRQAAFGVTRTPEAIAKIEATISGVHLFATGLGEKPVDSDNILQGGDINQERLRQAEFGYARNQRGEKIQFSEPQLQELFRRVRDDVAQGVRPCFSCCKESSCEWTTAKR